MRMAAVWFAFVYCLLYVCTIIINKYVLWVLGFTYPTLFQGWQTLVGLFVLRFVASLGHIELSSNVDRSALLQWLPVMVLFVCGIYSGSKALAKLPVPVFVCLQGQMEVISALVSAVINKQLPKIQVICSWVIITSSAISMWLTDPQYNSTGYKWMAFHLVVTSNSAIYMKWKKQFMLSDIDRLHYVYAFSVFVFAPASFFLGDLVSSHNFKFWYLSHFYMGCLLSGIFGVSLALCHLYIRQALPDLIVSLTVCAAKIFCVIASTMVYTTLFNNQFLFSIFCGLAGQLIHSIARHDGIRPPSTNQEREMEIVPRKLVKEQV